MNVFRLNHLDRVKSNSSHGLPTPFFPAGLGRHREEKEMTVTGNISHCLFKFGVSIKNPAPNSLFFFFFKTLPPMSVSHVALQLGSYPAKGEPGI